MTTLTVICTDPGGYPHPLIYTVEVADSEDEAAIQSAVKNERAAETGCEPEDVQIALKFAFEGVATLAHDWRP